MLRVQSSGKCDIARNEGHQMKQGIRSVCFPSRSATSASGKQIDFPCSTKKLYSCEIHQVIWSNYQVSSHSNRNSPGIPTVSHPLPFHPSRRQELLSQNPCNFSSLTSTSLAKETGISFGQSPPQTGLDCLAHSAFRTTPFHPLAVPRSML